MSFKIWCSSLYHAMKSINWHFNILLYKWIFCFSLCRLNLSLSSKFSLCWATGIQRCNSIHQLELQAFGATRFYTLISPSGYFAASGIRTKKRAANTERGREIFTCILEGDLKQPELGCNIWSYCRALIIDFTTFLCKAQLINNSFLNWFFCKDIRSILQMNIALHRCSSFSSISFRLGGWHEG